jgi:hypothetical protein
MQQRTLVTSERTHSGPSGTIWPYQVGCEGEDGRCVHLLATRSVERASGQIQTREPWGDCRRSSKPDGRRPDGAIRTRPAQFTEDFRICRGPSLRIGHAILQPNIEHGQAHPRRGTILYIGTKVGRCARATRAPARTHRPALSWAAGPSTFFEMRSRRRAGHRLRTAACRRRKKLGSTAGRMQSFTPRLSRFEADGRRLPAPRSNDLIWSPMVRDYLTRSERMPMFRNRRVPGQSAPAAPASPPTKIQQSNARRASAVSCGSVSPGFHILQG